MSSHLLFQMPMPEIRRSLKTNNHIQTHANRTIYLMDKDQIIMIRDGGSKIIMVGLVQQIELYKKKMKIL